MGLMVYFLLWVRPKPYRPRPCIRGASSTSGRARHTATWSPSGKTGRRYSHQRYRLSGQLQNRHCHHADARVNLFIILHSRMLTPGPGPEMQAIPRNKGYPETHFPLIKEYTLNLVRVPIIIYQFKVQA